MDHICDFYIQVRGLPLMNSHQGIAKLVGDAIGRFVSFDGEFNNGCLATSMTIRVGIDITKPLLRCLNIEGPRQQSLQL